MKTATRNINHVAQKIERLVNMSAKAWVDGNNSGDADILAIQTKREQGLAKLVEKTAKEHGIDSVDWPGLYPTYSVKGYTYYDALSALKAVI